MNHDQDQQAENHCILPNELPSITKTKKGQWLLTTDPWNLAESEGFEPPVGANLRLISSQLHSTELCQLSITRRSLPDWLGVSTGILLSC